MKTYNISKSKIIVFITIICTIILSNFSAVFAQTSFKNDQIPFEVKRAAQDNLDMIKNIVKSEAKNYGISDTDSNDQQIILGQGYEYYKISTSYLSSKYYKNDKSSSTYNKLFVPSGAYIFPVRVGNKPVAIAFIEFFQGKWTVVQISSYSAFESDLIAAEKLIESSQLDVNANAILIYDQYTHLTAVGVQSDGGEYIVPMVSNNEIEVNKNHIKKFSEFKEKILTFHNKMILNKNFEDGGASNTPDNSILNYTIMVVVAIAVVMAILLFFLFKRRYTDSIG